MTPGARPGGAIVRVDVLYTGGTFGMADHGAGMSPRSGLGAEIAELVGEFVAETGITVDLRYDELDQVIDSADADAGTAARIAERVRSGRTAGRAHGVIIIHGTDTMAYVGARLAFELWDSAVPIVLTGAQIPLGQPGSDARANLHLALRSLAAQLDPSTSLAFGSGLHPAVRASKRAVDEYAGFMTVRAATPPAAPVTLPATAGGPGGPVGLLTVFPGLHADLLEAALRHYHGGLVLECYGSGTAPMSDPALLAAVRRASERGTPILVITQCDSGAVDLARYQPGRALLEAGAVSGGDMTREAALAKLSYLVERGYSGPQLRRQLTTNLLGELSDPLAAVPIPSAKADIPSRDRSSVV
ncbi:asparaginase [Nocardia sp. 2]|uniref:Asparaginase n=1 Tax=Nocardia acididurans TaxID=2802282 RepID=A0ABS1M3I9_9NOCA|nr:asparaginase domain-containing protein [Nocardia acididurans]MBL1073703.1 asparaginase [Nocardia acididurans]